SKIFNTTDFNSVSERGIRPPPSETLKALCSVGSFCSCPVFVAHQLSAFGGGDPGESGTNPWCRFAGQRPAATALSPVSLFDLRARFFVPTHGAPSASGRDAVKAGRRAGRAAGGGASGPRLDGVEHEAKLAGVGAAIWRPC